jgi:hypothetical protein
MINPVYFYVSPDKGRTIFRQKFGRLEKQHLKGPVATTQSREQVNGPAYTLELGDLGKLCITFAPVCLM